MIVEGATEEAGGVGIVNASGMVVLGSMFIVMLGFARFRVRFLLVSRVSDICRYGVCIGDPVCDSAKFCLLGSGVVVYLQCLRSRGFIFGVFGAFSLFRVLCLRYAVSNQGGK